MRVHKSMNMMQVEWMMDCRKYLKDYERIESSCVRAQKYEYEYEAGRMEDGFKMCCYHTIGVCKSVSLCLCTGMDG